jgi:diaminopimelate decarboxylase
MARELGFPGTSIVFNGPHKPDEALRTGIAERALININDFHELQRLLALTHSAEEPVEVGLRISTLRPDGCLSRFGFSLDDSEAIEAVETLRRAPHLRLAGLHTHLYSDTDDPELYAQAAQRLGQFAAQHIPDYKRTIRFIDMGGSFPAHSPKPRSRDAWNPRPIDVYVRSIAEALGSFFPDRQSRPTMIVEPGRYLTCDGILFISRVIHVKERQGRQVINCDGSISMVPLVHYCPPIIYPYTCQLNQRRGTETATTIYGATCRENDILYEGQFPRTECGDFLVHFAVGAYNSSLCPEFIFSQPVMEFI